MAEREFILVADSETGKVGCANIQAILGGTVPREKLCLLDWEVGRFDYMRRYRIAESKLDRLIEARRGCPTT